MKLGKLADTVKSRNIQEVGRISNYELGEMLGVVYKAVLAQEKRLQGIGIG